MAKELNPLPNIYIGDNYVSLNDYPFCIAKLLKVSNKLPTRVVLAKNYRHDNFYNPKVYLYKTPTYLFWFVGVIHLNTAYILPDIKIRKSSVDIINAFLSQLKMGVEEKIFRYI